VAAPACAYAACLPCRPVTRVLDGPAGGLACLPPTCLLQAGQVLSRPLGRNKTLVSIANAQQATPPACTCTPGAQLHTVAYLHCLPLHCRDYTSKVDTLMHERREAQVRGQQRDWAGHETMQGTPPLKRSKPVCSESCEQLCSSILTSRRWESRAGPASLPPTTPASPSGPFPRP